MKILLLMPDGCAFVGIFQEVIHQLGIEIKPSILYQPVSEINFSQAVELSTKGFPVEGIEDSESPSFVVGETVLIRDWSLALPMTDEAYATFTEADL